MLSLVCGGVYCCLGVFTKETNVLSPLSLASPPAPAVLLAANAGGHLRTPDLLIIAVYLLAITLFGLRFRQKNTSGSPNRAPDRTLKTYFLAANTIPWWAIALSVVSAETSTLTIISIPGIAFTGNFGFLQVVLGYLLGRVVVALLFLPRYFAGEMLTAYQLIDRRFGPLLHKTTAGLFLLTRAAAEGVRVFAVSIVVGIAIGTGDVLSIGIISALTLLYTFEGGMAAVIWTDVVQMAIYIGGTLIALLTLGHHVPGGWPVILHTASAAHKLTVLNFAFNLTQSYTFWAGLLGGTFLTMASHGTDQLMVQRLLAARNLRESQLALLSSGVVIFFQFAFFLLIGVGLWVFYRQAGAPGPASGTGVSGLSPDRLFPTFITREMPVGIAGLLVAAILAAAMSNLSAALNSLSSTTVVDFYLRLRPTADDRERTLISKSSTALWAVVLFAIAVYSVRVGGKGHVVEIGLSIASVAYGCLLGVFLLGTLTRFASETGTAIGMLCGFVLNLWLWQGKFPVHLGPLTIPHIAFTWFVLIGAVVTFAIGALASLVLHGPQTARPAVITAAALLSLFGLSSRSFGFSSPSFGLSSHSQAQGSAAPLGTAQTTHPRTGDPRTPNPAAIAPTPAMHEAPLPHFDFTPVSALIDTAIAQGKLPGAVLAIGHAGQTVFHQAYGNRKLAGEPRLDGQPSPAEPMSEDTVFDMASLTKGIVTATAIGELYDQKKLNFDDPVERFLPEFNPTHDPQRTHVTLRLLLTHFSGEAPDVDLKDPWGLAAPDKAEGLRRALTTSLAGTPGAKFVYSDINFILLGAVIEKISGERLENYAQEHIFQPLGMGQTAYHAFDGTCGPYHPLGSAIVLQLAPHTLYDIPCTADQWSVLDISQTAPTAHDDEGTPATNPDFNHLLRGTVHDPTTRRMGGVAGHAGVFSTAADMSLFAQALLDRLAGRPSKFPVKRLTLELMTTPEQPGHTPFQLGEAFRAQQAAQPNLPTYPALKGQTLRGFGWDLDSGYSRPRGRVFPIGSFGHTGFTGTSLWLDPGSDTFVLLLANAIHPHAGQPISNLRGEVATAAAQALGLYPPPSTPQPFHSKLPNSPLKTEQNSCPAAGADADCEPSQTPLTSPSAPSPKTGTNNTAAGMQREASGQLRPLTQTGLDVLEATHFQILADSARHVTTFNLALLTNQTGIDSHHRRSVDILAGDLPKAVPNARLLTLFSPEHGIFGRQDTEHLHAETDPATGLPVTSLYGAHEADRRPSHEQLKDLNAVIIDLQDAGVRCYTYETVVGYFLEAAALERTAFHHDLEIVVLDRPNPITGLTLAGPVSDPGTASYINYMPLPLQHGLTLGELARYINRSRQLNAHLTVVPMQGWRRAAFFDETGLPWVNPSPNLRSLTAETLYPATAMLELTNLSVGRGTTLAFESFGVGTYSKSPDSPLKTEQNWFNAEQVATALNARALPGVRFEVINLAIPEDANHYPFHGQTIPAVHILLTDRNTCNAPELGLELLSTLHRLYPTQFQLEKAMRLVANRATLDALARGDDPRRIAASWQPALDQFRQARQPDLLY